ncbi:MAG: energy transducer TonB [Gammaproteobacteria bacterium]
MALAKKRKPEQTAGIIFVVLIHLALFWALREGLAHSVVELLKAPIVTKIIEEVIEDKKNEPPPPPPQIVDIPLDYTPPPAMEVAQEAPITESKPIQESAPPPPPPPPREPKIELPKANPKRPNTQPPYPPTARRMGQEGSVVLALLVGADGKVIEAKVDSSSGFPALDDAAVKEASRRWKFIPGTKDGAPAAMWHKVKVTFKLTD